MTAGLLQQKKNLLLYIEHRQDGLMMGTMVTIRPREAHNYSLQAGRGRD